MHFILIKYARSHKRSCCVDVHRIKTAQKSKSCQSTKTEPLKKAVCQTFKSIGEGIEETWGSTCAPKEEGEEEGEGGDKKEEDSGLPLQLFRDFKLLLKTVLDLFAGTWLNLREPLVKPDNLEAIGVMLQVFEKETVELYFSKTLAQVSSILKE